MKRFLVLLICVLVLLPSCTHRKQMYSQTYLSYFDTVTVIYGFESDEATFLQNADRISQVIGEYHRLFDIYHEYDGITNLCTLNRCASGDPLPCDDRLCDLLRFAKEAYTFTEGKVNVAMGSVLTLWHDAREQSLNGETEVLPSNEALQNAASHCAISDLIIEGNAVSLLDPEMRLDVGAVAKGYTAERVAEWIADQGLTGYAVNLGGNIRAVGEKPSGEEWICGIQDPDTDASRYQVRMGSQTLVTSGDYQRYFELDGTRYHHIIDPATLYPAIHFRSVSVLCSDSAKADALSTGLFCMTYEEGRALVDSLPQTEALWICSDGTVYMTDGMKNAVVQ